MLQPNICLTLAFNKVCETICLTWAIKIIGNVKIIFCCKWDVYLSFLINNNNNTYSKKLCNGAISSEREEAEARTHIT